MKRYIVTFKDPATSESAAASLLQVQSKNLMRAQVALGAAEAPRKGTVLHFEGLGASALELSERDAAELRKNDEVAEVVEDFEVFALGDCGCGSGSGYAGDWSGAGPSGAEEVDPYVAGYQQAMYELGRSDGGTAGWESSGGAAGPADQSRPDQPFPPFPPRPWPPIRPPWPIPRPCPPGTRRICLRSPSPWFPPRCFCIPLPVLPPPTPPLQPIPWNIELVRANLVWSRVTGTGVKVAVLDTGIDDSHPDVPVSGGASFVPGVPSWKDGHSHGTHCAGIIGARNNAVGVVGVAPGCDLYAVKVLSDSGSGNLSWILAGMGWAAQNGMHVVSMSLGSDAEENAACVLAYQRAAEQCLNAGTLVVAAAGNSGTTSLPWVGHPARCPGFMAVAAVDSNRALASFSSRGPASLCNDCGVEIAAPGVSVNSTVPGGGYQVKSGTSMACPHVSGAAALLKQLHPSWTPAQIRARLRATAQDLGVPGNDPGTGSGLLDCHRAVFG